MTRKIYFVLFAFFLLASFVYTEPKEKLLVNKEIDVPRGDVKRIHFLVPEDGNKWQFRGWFRTKGGFNDDINLYVMTQENYVRWYSKYDSEFAVKMEKKKEGSFKIDAKPGETYYFVFANFFSTVSNKKIKFKLELAPEH